VTPIAKHIQEEIERHGPISFAHYMELALYAPGMGYYERQKEIGRYGDFFTSVSVGPLFGELLAFQFAEWLGGEKCLDRVQLIEAGAHQGALAADILGWLERRRPHLYSRVEYIVVEPSTNHRAWQEDKLRAWGAKIKWVTDMGEIGASPAKRIVFGNELLDAMPVHRLVWDRGESAWKECYVAGKNGTFSWQRGAVSPEVAGALPVIGPELAEVLPDGFVIEHSPAAVAWWRNAAKRVGQGKLLTFDYGYTSDEQFRPERSNGTLRTFGQHHAGGDLLEKPGELDITAHVNFTAIEAAGRAAGLATEAFMEQGKYLTQILARTQAAPDGFDPWTPARTRQFQTLTHPGHLGHAFRMLVQNTGRS